MSEVRLIPDWRERWEPVTAYRSTVLTGIVVDGEEYAIVRDDDGVIVLSKFFKSKPRPKTYRPWKREEVPVGSVVRCKVRNVAAVINCVELGNSCVGVSTMGWHTLQGMLDNFVLHATSPDGTWIPTEQCPKCGVEE